jgi:hypothetical protein
MLDDKERQGDQGDRDQNDQRKRSDQGDTDYDNM